MEIEKLTRSTKQVFLGGSISTAFVHDCSSTELTEQLLVTMMMTKKTVRFD